MTQKIANYAKCAYLNDAVVEGGVPLRSSAVQGGGVLDDEVHHVQGGTRLVADRVVQERLGELLDR